MCVRVSVYKDKRRNNGFLNVYLRTLAEAIDKLYHAYQRGEGRSGKIILINPPPPTKQGF